MAPAPTRSIPPRVIVALLAAAPTLAGGSEEDAILLVDPSNPESLHVANHYLAVRDLPRGNVIYMRPGAADYATLAADGLRGFLGSLAHRGLDHVDYVVIPPAGEFYVPAPGLVADGCFPVNRFSIAAPYTLAHQSADILGHLVSDEPNEYFKTGWAPRAFDGQTGWLGGNPSADPGAQRYFVAALLGYTGERGNTLDEVLQMIDRSAAADATHPGGTFYFMQTTDTARSSPRHGAYSSAVAQITGDGGAAQHLFANLPIGQHDCLGIMTGLASPDVDSADLTLLPGSFADHLTSFAGRFDTSSQTKMSRWIAKGASGTCGTVEEPCNYPGKFPHARFHVVYSRGLSLGEAWFRAVGFLPFQNLCYGDPLTRPFANPPTVTVPDAPLGPVSGLVTLTPDAQPTEPGALIDKLELFVDGRLVATQGAGGAFALDTGLLADGWHDLRVIARDDALERNAGRFRGELVVANRGHSVTLAATPLAGDLVQRFDCAISATTTGGAVVRELRLLQSDRVVAAAAGPEIVAGAATLAVHGRRLGAGPVRLRAEAELDDGSLVRSAPLDLTIAPVDGPASGTAPVAYGFTKTVSPDHPFVLELPATHDDDLAGASYTILQPPAKADVLTAGAGPYRVLAPRPWAETEDTLAFRVETPSGSSAVATVTLRFEPLAAPPGEAVCFGDGSGTSCPCGNDAATEREGCAHSGGRGMRIFGFGSQSVAADDLELAAEGCPIFNSGIFYVGRTSLEPGSPLYDGLQCAAGDVRRFRGLFQADGVARDTGFGAQDPSGVYFVPGATYWFQYWSRDVVAGPSPCGTAANFSPAYRVTATP